MSYLFGAIDRASKSSRLVAFVGDSTMNSLSPDGRDIPYLVQKHLAETKPERSPRAIQAGLVGLSVRDAAPMIAKLLGRQVDVIVYGLTLRAFEREPTAVWATNLANELSPADLNRLAWAGDGRWLRENLDAGKLAGGLVESAWSTYAYRGALRRALWDASLGWLLPSDAVLRTMVEPPLLVRGPRVGGRSGGRGGLSWSREDYGAPGPNWDALEVVADLCQRFAPGRCILYAGPLNWQRRQRFVDPVFYAESIARMREVVEQHGVTWLDLTDLLDSPDDFRRPMYGGPIDPIHPSAQGRVKIAGLLVDPVVQALQRAEGERRPAP